jgi:hypothetical protein
MSTALKGQIGKTAEQRASGSSIREQIRLQRGGDRSRFRKCESRKEAAMQSSPSF